MEKSFDDIYYFINSINSSNMENTFEDSRIVSIFDKLGIEAITFKTFRNSIEDNSYKYYVGRIDNSLVKSSFSRTINDTKTVTVTFYCKENHSEANDSFYQICIEAIINRISYLVMDREYCNIRFYDLMTKLPNINSFQKRIETLINSGRIQEYTAAFLNIKKCSAMTKIFGGEIADDIFVNFAAIASSYFNNDDGEMFARIGGDNFIFLVRKGKEDELISKLKQVNIQFESGSDLIDYTVECRMGIAPLDSSCVKFSPILAAVTNAVSLSRDTASDIYWARHANIDKIYSDVFDLSNKLHSALEKHQLLVYYQPIYKISDASSTPVLCEAEALVRWRTDSGMVPPSQFIPVAEKSGLIGRIDLYVLDVVCSKLKEWKENGISIVPIHCNFSTYDLTNTSLSDVITSIVDKYGVDHKYLTFEFSENAFHDEYDLFLHTASELIKNGFNVAIHNFGSGYASIVPLQKLNFTSLKLDSSLINSDSDKNSTLLKGIINTCQGIGLDIIGEGARDNSVIDKLIDCGCDLFQAECLEKPLSERFFTNKLSGLNQ